ncbi:hypothetical protein [Massilia sp. METH4]|uniref:hypothetical protein n=1 Tax=Massilia sp. METH4 TaxID=3123041 RepID=UPI0030CDCD58
MEWFPTVAFTFKILVLAIGMFFAVKWHYDQGKKKNKQHEKGTRAVLIAGGKVAAIFTLSLVGLGLFTFFLMKTFGLGVMMTLP